MSEEENYRSVYEILKQPLSDIRVEVSDKFFSMKLTHKDFIDYSTELLQTAEKIKGISLSELAEEIQNAYQFIKTGKSTKAPNVKDSAHQFVWGLALACSVCDPEIKKNWKTAEKYLKLHKYEVWKQIRESAPARAELRRHAFMVAKLPFMKEDVRMKWGTCNYPSIGFYYNDQRNMINLDMLWALIGGFEHSRSAQLHEIGHSQGSLVYTPGMQRIQKEHKEINKKVREGTASKEEQRRLKILQKEYDFRFSLYDEAENSYANRFAVNAADFGRVHQDIAYDLNSMETQLFHVGKRIRKYKGHPPTPKDSIFSRSYNLKQAIRYSFFVNNGIIEDDDEGWKKLGVNIDWIEYKAPDGTRVSGREAFDKLREMTKRLELLQLKERDYHKSEDEIYNISLEYSRQRGEIIDEIYDGFAKEYFEEYLKQMDENQEQNQSDGQNSGGDDGGSQQSGGGNGNDDAAEHNIFDTPPEEVVGDEEYDNHDSSDDSELGNAVSHGQSSDGDEKSDEPGEKSDTSEPKAAEPEQKADTSEPQASEPQQDNPEPEESNKEKRDYDDLTDEEKEHLREDENGDIERKEFASIFDNLIMDEGDMPPLDDLFENPEDMMRALIEALQENLDEDDDAEDIMDIIRAPIEPQDNRDDNSGMRISDTPPVMTRNSRTLMPENEFSEIVERNFDLIEQLKVKFTELQNKYYDDDPEAESLALMPEAGNLKVDIPSYIERLKKQITGEEMTEKDFENFVIHGGAKDQVKAPIDIAILIDTSGSMKWAGTDKFALETGCVLFQATRDNPAFNVYVVTMSNPTTWIIKPGENSIEISKRLSKLDEYGYDDDKIGDNIVQVLQEVKDRERGDKVEGFTNFFMITDGDHTDSDVSFPLIEKAIEGNVPATFNWLLTCSKNHSEARRIIDAHKTGIGPQKVECSSNINKSNMLEKIMELIEKRVEDIKEIEAMRVGEKTDSIATFLTGLKKGGRNG